MRTPISAAPPAHSLWLRVPPKEWRGRLPALHGVPVGLGEGVFLVASLHRDPSLTHPYAASLPPPGPLDLARNQGPSAFSRPRVLLRISVQGSSPISSSLD